MGTFGNQVSHLGDVAGFGIEEDKYFIHGKRCGLFWSAVPIVMDTGELLKRTDFGGAEWSVAVIHMWSAVTMKVGKGMGNDERDHAVVRATLLQSRPAKCLVRRFAC
ncbi:MAG: hypothetical protein ACJASX_004612 [Limisphaerales bacterium]|jgi:hypothetical protein